MRCIGPVGIEAAVPSLISPPIRTTSEASGSLMAEDADDDDGDNEPSVDAAPLSLEVPSSPAIGDDDCDAAPSSIDDMESRGSSGLTRARSSVSADTCCTRSKAAVAAAAIEASDAFDSSNSSASLLGVSSAEVLWTPSKSVTHDSSHVQQ